MFVSKPSDVHNHMTFFQLDILIECLLRETYSMHQEFFTKSQYLNENILKCTQNEYQISHLFEAIDTLQFDIKVLEMDLECIGCDLMSCVKLIDKVVTPQYGYCCFSRGGVWQREIFMRLIEETDFKMWDLQTPVSEIDEILRFTGIGRSSYIIIFQILNSHIETLSHTEKNLDIILDKLILISHNLGLTLNRSKKGKPAVCS
ncbi:uncharacterized protein LOC142219994 [Haematobia irritans]|uniref:uncharacterized protein LOC142219994 n=1 Tax=Haematobia irritans TaxID=7368 RepID=UPI003F4F8240